MSAAAAAAGATAATTHQSHHDNHFRSFAETPYQNHFSLAPKTLPKPYKHLFSNTRKIAVTAASSKNPLKDVVLDGHSFGSYFDDDDKPREECGVVGIYGDPEASRLCYLALHSLQHRGQEGAGIVAVHENVLQTITG